MISSATRKTAMLAALSLLLSTIELLLPKPVPFFRIGLANLPLLIGLVLLTSRHYWLLVVLKIAGQGIIGGTLFSYVFLLSLAGSLSSGAVMFLLFRLPQKWRTLVGVSMGGALASNLAQAVTAGYLLLGIDPSLILFPLLVTGLISSVILGGTAEIFIKRSRWIELVRQEDHP